MKKGLTVFIGLLLLLIPAKLFFSKDKQPETRILRLAHGLNTQHPVHKTMEFMAQRVKELSEGKLIVEIYPSEQLGNEKECIEGLQLGYLAMTKTSTAPMEGFVPRMKIFGIPYLFNDGDHFWKVAKGPIGKELLEEGASVGLKGLCYFDAGARSFYAKKPIQHPDDLDGLKVRVMNSKTCMDMVSAMGGSPTPISWGELYTSLDQGVVDAAENNPPSFETSRHFEVCRYYILDEHLRLPDMLLISTKIWEGLSPEFQTVLNQAIDEAVAFNIKLWGEAEKASVEKVKADGVEVIYPDKAPFQAAVQSMWKDYEEELGDLIKRIQAVK
ncbi:TRAP transporter substrate-binding protein [Planctomycetota bacterium]